MKLLKGDNLLKNLYSDFNLIYQTMSNLINLSSTYLSFENKEFFNSKFPIEKFKEMIKNDFSFKNFSLYKEKLNLPSNVCDFILKMESSIKKEALNNLLIDKANIEKMIKI